MTAAQILLPSGEESELQRLGTELLKMTEDERRAHLASVRNEDDLEAAERALALVSSAGWRASPAAMGNHLDPAYQRFDYVNFLSNKFVDAVEGRSTRQVWNLPSRYGKTTLAEWGCVWVLDRTSGKAKMILVSWGHDLAARTAVNVRDKLVMYEEHLRGQLRPDRRRNDQFVTDAGGGLYAAGIDAGLVGFGAGQGGGIIVDDPFKNWQAAHSGARRDHVESQFKGTIRNRLDEEAAWIIVIHHRVHRDDLSARLMADTINDTGDEWEHVVLPARAVEDDPLGREPGEPLEPKRFTLIDVIARARGLGSYLASGLEQQDPSEEEGDELLREWFALMEPSEMPARPGRAITSWDLKLKNSEAGDYVVGQCWWAVGEGRYCVDQIRGHYDHATTANAIALLQVRHPEAKRNVVETAASYSDVVPELKKPIVDYLVTEAMAERLGMSDDERDKVQRLRRLGMRNIDGEAATEGSKSVRARTHIVPIAEAGHVRLPADAPWVAGWLDEMAAFPRGLNDDQVDAASQALKRLAKRAGGAGMGGGGPAR